MLSETADITLSQSPTGQPAGGAEDVCTVTAPPCQPPYKGLNIMGKYFIAWLLGVPTLLLVVLYFFFM